MTGAPAEAPGTSGGPALSPEAAASAHNLGIVLASVDTRSLLRTLAALTHRIHDADAAPVTCARTRGDYADDLRLQRAWVEDEVLRRTGDYR